MAADMLHDYVGLGPMALDDEFMVGNQREVVRAMLGRITAAERALSDSIHLPDQLRRDFAPHHVITIVGNRGIGKTSVLMTIAKAVRKEIQTALVLDIIHPDRLSALLPVSGVVVHSIEKALKREEPDLAKELFQEDSLRFRDPSWTLDTMRTYDVIARETISVEEWNSRLYELLSSPADAVSTFHAWIERLLERANKTLLVVLIDDADIAIEKAEEVIDTLRTYLTSPQIVTILAVDLPSLERRLRNNRLDKLPKLPEFREQSENSGSGYLFGMTGMAFHSAEAKAEYDYVLNLLTKVLPPAARYHLSGLSERDRLHRPFRIPGRAEDRSVLDVLRSVYTRVEQSDEGNMAELIEVHPEIFSDNLRQFANQYVMVSDSCARYVAESANMSDADRARMLDLYEHTIGSESALASDQLSTSGIRLSPIRDAENLLHSMFCMDVLRPFLNSGEFAAAMEVARSEYSIEIDRLDTIQELVTFILLRTAVTGTENYRLTYSLATRPIDASSGTGLVGLCIDWALADGVRLENIIETLAIQVAGLAYRPVPIPKQLAKCFTRAPISSFDTNITTVDAAFEERIGSHAIVTVDRDRLAPAYITDSAGLGRYHHRVMQYHRMRQYDDHAQDFVQALDGMEEKDVQPKDIQAAFYRCVGLLSIQACYHIDALVLELGFDGDVQQFAREDPSYFHGDAKLPWTLVEVRGILDTLLLFMTRKREQLPDYRKLLGVCYLADLPMRAVLGAVSGPEARSKRDALLHSIAELLDTLSETGLVTGRERGKLDVGRIVSDPAGEACAIWEALNYGFSSLDWMRRWSAVAQLIATLQEAQFQDTWQSRSEPPELWKTWASRVVKTRGWRK